MGNTAAGRLAGKVILPDGSLQAFPQATTVADLMLDHPHQVVVDLTAAGFKPKKSPELRLTEPTPMAADEKLAADKLDLMLPLKRGRVPSISAAEARRLLLRVDAMIGVLPAVCGGSRWWSRLLVGFARICPAGGGERGGGLVVVPRRRVEVRGVEEGDSGAGKGGLRRRRLGGGWRPSLETIEEKKEGKREVRLLVLAGKLGRRIETKGFVWG